jgi:hypothetical protein
MQCSSSRTMKANSDEETRLQLDERVSACQKNDVILLRFGASTVRRYVHTARCGNLAESYLQYH